MAFGKGVVHAVGAAETGAETVPLLGEKAQGGFVFAPAHGVQVFGFQRGFVHIGLVLRLVQKGSAPRAGGVFSLGFSERSGAWD